MLHSVQSLFWEIWNGPYRNEQSNQTETHCVHGIEDDYHFSPNGSMNSVKSQPKSPEGNDSFFFIFFW